MQKHVNKTTHLAKDKTEKRDPDSEKSLECDKNDEENLCISVWHIQIQKIFRIQICMRHFSLIRNTQRKLVRTRSESQ